MLSLLDPKGAEFKFVCMYILVKISLEKALSDVPSCSQAFPQICKIFACTVMFICLFFPLTEAYMQGNNAWIFSDQ